MHFCNSDILFGKFLSHQDMVTKDDVINAFRFILGRDPENEEIVARYATEFNDIKTLRARLLNSAEFSQKYAAPAKRALMPLNGSPLAVDIDVSETQMIALFSRIKAQWEYLGSTEPHWSVLISDSYFQKNFQMHRDVFYASGKTEVNQFNKTLDRNNVAVDRTAVCLELGCGVGRVTWQLARLCQQVVAVDISSSHLDVARAYLAEVGIDNVQLCHIAELPMVESLPRFDLLYSRIVLQHNPPPVMAWLLDKLLKRMNPGGIAYFQIPTYRIGYRFNVEEYLVNPNIKSMEMHYLPQPELFRILTRRGCQLMEVREDDAIGAPDASALSNTVLVRKAKTVNPA